MTLKNWRQFKEFELEDLYVFDDVDQFTKIDVLRMVLGMLKQCLIAALQVYELASG